MSKQVSLLFAGLLTVCVLGWYVDAVAHREIVTAIKTTVYGITVAAVASLIIGIVAFLCIAIERVREVRTKRRLAQREADVYAIESEAHGVFVRETNPNAVWLPLHNTPKWRISSNAPDPSPLEFATWQMFTHRSQRLAPNEPIPLLPAATQIDLLTALDPVQRCLIVGPSDAGKTTLLQWIICRRQNISKVIVIDPHAYPEKWPHCIVLGTGRNYIEIDRALNALIQLMTKRYDEIGKGLVAEMAHHKLTIVIDEWRAIVYNVKDASEAIKTLLTESRKAAFSVFVGTHSERVKALGLEGEGDLKDGFAVVRLSLVNGLRQATIDTGNGEIPVLLPGPYIGNHPTVIEANEIINLVAEAKPTEREQQILDLAASGVTYAKICEAVWGYKSSKKYPEIDAVLAKFGRVHGAQA
jgi:hypothetical protein